MKTQFYTTATQRRRFRLMLFILLALSLLWFFQCEDSHSAHNDSKAVNDTTQPIGKNDNQTRKEHTLNKGGHSQQQAHKTTTQVDRNMPISDQSSHKRNIQIPKRLKIVRNGKLYEGKRHKISQDIIEADTVYIMIRNMVDITRETERYPLWHEQVNYLTKEGAYSLRDYHKRFTDTKMQLIPEAKYHDSLPKPHLILETYLTEFCLAHGKKQKFPETYWAETDTGEMLYTDLTWQQQYKTVSLTATFKLLDYHCYLIVSSTESAEFTHACTFTRYFGDRRILPMEAANRNWSPISPLRENEYVVMKSLKKLLERVLGRTGAFLDPLARRRANINVPDYSGTL